MASSTVKKRNWAFVAYPESLPTDWLDILTATGLPFSISPLHEYDVDPTGELKKPHYHVILAYSGPTSFAVVKRLTDSLLQPIPQALENVRGYYRYFTHKDNPEKFQYSDTAIRCFNGFAISDFSDLTRSEVSLIKRKIISIIEDNNFVEYADLIRFCIDNEQIDYFDIASTNTIFFDKYLSSRRYQK